MSKKSVIPAATLHSFTTFSIGRRGGVSFINQRLAKSLRPSRTCADERGEGGADVKVELGLVDANNLCPYSKTCF